MVTFQTSMKPRSGVWEVDVLFSSELNKEEERELHY